MEFTICSSICGVHCAVHIIQSICTSGGLPVVSSNSVCTTNSGSAHLAIRNVITFSDRLLLQPPGKTISLKEKSFFKLLNDASAKFTFIFTVDLYIY